jgi:hypothetical protein
MKSPPISNPSPNLPNNLAQPNTNWGFTKHITWKLFVLFKILPQDDLNFLDCQLAAAKHISTIKHHSGQQL